MTRKPYNTKRIRAAAANEETYEGRLCLKHNTRTRRVENTVCIQCAKEPSYYERNREVRLEAAKKYQKHWRQQNPARGLLQNAKSSAAFKNFDFNLELSDIQIPTICPVLGIPLDNRDRSHGPSVDRHDNSKGYVKGNIRIISHRANRLKNDASITEIEAILAYMRT